MSPRTPASHSRSSTLSHPSRASGHTARTPESDALADLSDLKHFDRTFHNTSLLRTRGTDALIATAQSAGVTRFVIQSYASARCVRSGEW